ncbi:hypothetical protein FLP41_09730 [Paracoccus marcusii]|uniref:hypothetical protein n=1 Tax=Paracoccus marcusii TaxID=59779 RepID=UPI002ED45D86|nr:hypothetical protein FLP41_09730 [Paracoccus marcusii]
MSEAIWRLAKGRTSLLITHDLSQAARADRIVFLEAGRVAEQGSHADLLARGGRYARLWALQGRGQDGGAACCRRLIARSATVIRRWSVCR